MPILQFGAIMHLKRTYAAPSFCRPWAFVIFVACVRTAVLVEMADAVANLCVLTHLLLPDRSSLNHYLHFAWLFWRLVSSHYHLLFLALLIFHVAAAQSLCFPLAMRLPALLLSPLFRACLEYW